ncbi:MAG: MarC family protein [Methylicorpusculum sp.]|uniref:MarC family protein n=1 Tax=Methylicorpusculum sp. TaxID=2713644 RepID=UPI002728CE19|nr:MarC family protein [Methylicorpusculum sp.]MDO8843031.1 MarC family protein [Methylicorpusculum sp.]MDO8939000.1 MarC family protein [Methylicorpusculum sp.]MDO9242003.1 MarC family protein [Methylicorpusculum sp.]MDP2178949.1 MarC family protein [Methylicorpusculum sp.]MDP2201822.1 MarC family protein [Methylicorpusculum sp.]
MLEIAAIAMATLFTTIGPLDVAAVFAVLTVDASPKEKSAYAWRGTLIASAILFLFALTGDFLLTGLGISMSALRTSGGILLLLIAIDMVFVRSSGATSTTDEETHEARLKADISVFPLATPLIAGPGAMGAVVLLMAQAKDNWAHQMVVFVSLFLMMMVTLLSLLAASRIQRFLGVTGIQVVTRISGILLSALAVQFIFDGIAQSGLLRPIAAMGG